MARLTGQQKRQLRDCLLDAFTDLDHFDAFLSLDLDRNRAAITTASGLEAIILNIIEKAESEGWTLELLQAAARARRNLVPLQSVVNPLIEYVQQPESQRESVAEHPAQTALRPVRDAGAANTVTLIREIGMLLDDSGAAVRAIDHRSQALRTGMIRRLNIKGGQEDEQFYVDYYDEMLPEERAQFQKIRNITRGQMQEANRSLLSLLKEHPELIAEIPSLGDLRRHLSFWVTKYGQEFEDNPKMAVLFAGQEDRVDFPGRVVPDVKNWLAAHAEGRSDPINLNNSLERPMTADTLDDLRNALADAYDDLPRARELAERAGIRRKDQPTGVPTPSSWWWETLRTAQRQGVLVDLLDKAIADPAVAAWKTRFEELREPVAQLQAQPAPAPGREPVAAGKPTVFISYSHMDEAWKERLATQLKVLAKLGLLDAWDDRRIRAGDDWRPAIQAAMDRAAVAVLLISADYLTSDFVLGEEIPRLLERREQEGLRVIPLIVRPCPWKLVPWLKEVVPWPKDAKDGRALAALTSDEADDQLAALAYEIADIVGVPRG